MSNIGDCRKIVVRTKTVHGVKTLRFSGDVGQKLVLNVLEAQFLPKVPNECLIENGKRQIGILLNDQVSINLVRYMKNTWTTTASIQLNSTEYENLISFINIAFPISWNK